VLPRVLVAVLTGALSACVDTQTPGSPWSGSATTPASTTHEGMPDDPSSSGDEAPADTSIGDEHGVEDTLDTETEADASESGTATTDGSPLDPPAGGSSGGSGGGPVEAELVDTGTGVLYRLIAPADAGPLPFLLVYSGTEGSQPMSINLLNWRGATGTSGFVIAVLHGVEYYGDTQAGIDTMDHVRSLYDIDNDRMYLLSESAGTVTGLQLGLEVRQGWFAAYWANDVNASAVPVLDAEALGFAPWGNAGPGGQFAAAQAIVDGMAGAGYRIEEPAPYDGPGAGTHGDLDQLAAAVSWFPGKSRQ
jgi:hypothetical protein